MKKLINIKKKPLIFLVLIIITATIGGTIAYFKSEANLSNKFKTSTFNIEIDENFEGEWKPDDGWTTKEVSFVNKEIVVEGQVTNAPAVLRINYNELWSKEVDGKLLILNNMVNKKNVVLKTWTNAFKNDFIDGNDGWYYYKKVLSAQSSVKVLESIKLDKELIESSPDAEQYKDFNYELTFNFEAVQADKNAVNEVWGHDIEISGNDVTWQFK